MLSVPTVSSRRPKTEAEDRIVLSMKLRLYVMNMRGIRRQSILRKTRFASASCSASKWITSGAGCEAVISVCLEGSMVRNPGSTKVRELMLKFETATDAEIYRLLHRSCGVTKHMRRNSFYHQGGFLLPRVSIARWKHDMGKWGEAKVGNARPRRASILTRLRHPAI
jgi:hypothetical protein